MPQSDSLIFTPTPCILARVYFALHLISLISCSFFITFLLQQPGQYYQRNSPIKIPKNERKTHYSDWCHVKTDKLLKYVWKPKGDAIIIPISSQKPKLIMFCKVSHNQRETDRSQNKPFYLRSVCHTKRYPLMTMTIDL